MNVLAIETSTRRLSVALSVAGAIRERNADCPNAGSELVLPWVNELLAEAGIGYSAVDAVAFGAGPGGFTGLRLACGVAQGLAFGLDRPVLGVGSLEALALASGETRAFACVDARMNEVYVAAYRVTATGIEECAAPQVLPPEAVMAPDGGDWCACGDGYAAYGARLPVMARINTDVWPTATAVARLAAERLAHGEGAMAATAAPRYVRDKVALTTAERLARGGAR